MGHADGPTRLPRQASTRMGCCAVRVQHGWAGSCYLSAQPLKNHNQHSISSVIRDSHPCIPSLYERYRLQIPLQVCNECAAVSKQPRMI